MPEKKTNKEKRKIILASQSMRRKQLLEQIGVTNFEICLSEYEEDMTLDKSPQELAMYLALEKGRTVARKFSEAIVISGDTIVFCEDKIFGKPKTREEAQEMLKRFSGKKVGGVSGLALFNTATGQEIVTHGVGWMHFRKLSSREIVNYVQAEENVLRFAGGFGLLDKGAVLVEKYKGDFFSIVGLPVSKLYLNLKKMGVDLFK